MKLRNKKTGEIITCWFNTEGELLYDTLDELNEDWEDYKEVDFCWYLDCNGEIIPKSEIANFYNPAMKQIGNYFKTKKEAEKAVEKLKAWKRLKDKGFRFNGGDDACISYETDIEDWTMQNLQDFKMLFGGEE